MTTVVLIEDHKKIRAMIKEILEDASDFQVVGSAADGRVGYDLVLTLRPQVVIVDLGLWQFTGPALTQRLKTLIPEIAIIGISACLEDFAAARMLGAGADACLDKQFLVEKLEDTVRANMKAAS